MIFFMNKICDLDVIEHNNFDTLVLISLFNAFIFSNIIINLILHRFIQ